MLAYVFFCTMFDLNTVDYTYMYYGALFNKVLKLLEVL